MAHIFSLAGKHALVTGATTPLARALAVGLAEAGATVSVTTTHAVLAEEVEANSILNECWAAASTSGQAKTIDLTDPAAVQAAVAELEAAVAPIDILVNATHGANIKPTLEATLADWQTEVDRNATTAFVACQAVGKGMVARGRGRIINLVSVVHDRGVPNCAMFSASQAVGKRMLTRGVGRIINLVSVLEDRGVPNAALFSASQGAVMSLTRTLAIEWGRGDRSLPRVTVNALGLGFYDGVAGPQGDENLHAILERYIPLRRLGQPADLQGAVVYLASDTTNYVQGELLMIDGAIANHA